MSKLFSVIEKNPKKYVYLPLLIYWVLLLVLTSIPSKSLPNYSINDKFVHFAAFSILSFMLCLAFYFQTRWNMSVAKIFLVTIALIAFYAAIDEIHQSFIPGRYADIFDWIADLVGGVLGAFLSLFFVKVSKYKNNSIKLEQT